MKKVLLALVVTSALCNSLSAMTTGDVSDFAELGSGYCRSGLKGTIHENAQALVTGINDLVANHNVLTQDEINKRVDVLEALFKAFADKQRNYKANVDKCILDN